MPFRHPTSIACLQRSLHALARIGSRRSAAIPGLVDGLTAQIPGLVDGLTARIPGLVGELTARIPGLVDGRNAQIPGLAGVVTADLPPGLGPGHTSQEGDKRGQEGSGGVRRG